jgi:hypothetical protein
LTIRKRRSVENAIRSPLCYYYIKPTPPRRRVMSERGLSRADQNRAIRQEALRESLSAGGHVQKVIDLSEKLADLKGTELNATDANRLKAAADIKLKIIDKYLASLKAVEMSGGLAINPLQELMSQLPRTDKPPSERK